MEGIRVGPENQGLGKLGRLGGHALLTPTQVLDFPSVSEGAVVGQNTAVISSSTNFGCLLLPRKNTGVHESPYPIRYATIQQTRRDLRPAVVRRLGFWRVR